MNTEYGYTQEKNEELVILMQNEAERVKWESNKQSWECLREDLEADIKYTKKLIYQIANFFEKGNKKNIVLTACHPKKVKKP